MQYKVKNSIKTNVVILSSLVLAACASGGGDFGTSNVISTIPPDKLADPKTPEYGDDSTGNREVEDELDPMLQPTLGTAVKTIRRNSHFNKDHEEQQADIKPKSIETINLPVDNVVSEFDKRLMESAKHGSYTTGNIPNSHQELGSVKT